MACYYNEIDPFAAAWLRELIKEKLIADGEVDERSIADVRPDDLRGFVQCHFFAGIGGWSYALRLAGWPDDRAVWTGSCPCQPFSSAGTQAGGHDPRDLWPVWFELIRQCRPVVVFGEQVEAAIGHGWLDRLCDDLEAEDYAIGACGLPGPSVGAFDIRSRLWFVADTECDRRQHGRRSGEERASRAAGYQATERGGLFGEVTRFRITRKLGVSYESRLESNGQSGNESLAEGRERAQRRRAAAGMDGCLADTNSSESSDGGLQRSRRFLQSETNTPVGFWRDCDWIPCADGKARPVEPGTFPLAHGIPARVGRLRGYGNAIKPQVAQVFIQSYCEARGLTHAD